MRIFIYACESFYGGLHGIEDFCIEEFEICHRNPIGHICNIGRELSQNVIEKYINVDRDYLDCNGPEDFDSEENYWEAYNYAVYEHIEWYAYKIKDKFNDMTIKDLEEIAARVTGPQSFIKEYCEEIPDDWRK